MTITAETLATARGRLEKETVEHSRYVDVLEDLHTRTDFPIPGHLYLLAAPAMNETVQLAKNLKARIVKGSHPFNPYLAVLLLARPPSATMGFRWKGFFEAGNAAINEPVLGQKLRASESPKGVTEFWGSATYRGADHYQTDFENGLYRRGCRTLIVGCADHLFWGLPEEAMHMPLRLFQEMALDNNSGPRCVVLAGGPTLLAARMRDPEIWQNSTVVSLLPFGLEASDLAHFMASLKTYEGMLKGVLEPGALFGHSNELYAATLSSHVSIRRALANALADLARQLQRDPTRTLRPLRWNDIKLHLPSKGELQSYGAELEHFKTLLTERPLVGAQTPPDARRPTGKRRKRRVGERNPASDPVGGL